MNPALSDLLNANGIFTPGDGHKAGWKKNVFPDTNTVKARLESASSGTLWIRQIYNVTLSHFTMAPELLQLRNTDLDWEGKEVFKMCRTEGSLGEKLGRLFIPGLPHRGARPPTEHPPPLLPMSFPADLDNEHYFLISILLRRKDQTPHFQDL